VVNEFKLHARISNFQSSERSERENLGENERKIM